MHILVLLCIVLQHNIKMKVTYFCYKVEQRLLLYNVSMKLIYPGDVPVKLGEVGHVGREFSGFWRFLFLLLSPVLHPGSTPT